MQTDGGITSRAQAIDTITQSFRRLGDGSRDGLDALYTADAINHEAQAEPPAARVAGPDGFRATSDWLRAAFSELDFTVEYVVVDGNDVVARSIMRGRHTGEFLTWDADGSLTVFPPTGHRFTQRQIHWFTLRDGKIAEHRAQRDDLGMARELHWIPPTPRYLLRMALARRRAQRPRNVHA